jgi:hypothetical protein
MFVKEWGGGRVRTKGIWKYNGVDELIPNVLYACMVLS